MQILRWAKRQADYFVAIYPVTYLDLLPSLYLEGFFLKAARVIPTDAAGWIKIRVNWNPNRLQRYSFHLRLTRKRWEFKRNGCYSIFRLKMLIMNNVTKNCLRKKCQIVTPIWGRWPHKAATSGALGGRHRGHWKGNPYRLDHRRGLWMSGPTVRHLFQAESLFVLWRG